MKAKKGNLTHPHVRTGLPTHLTSSFLEVSLLPNPLAHRYSSLLNKLLDILPLTTNVSLFPIRWPHSSVSSKRNSTSLFL